VTVTVTSTATLTATLTANPTSIAAGQSSILSWTSTGATSCSGSGGLTATGTTGSVSVAPTQTTTYTIICTNGSTSVSSSATVVVAAISSSIIVGSRVVTNSALNVRKQPQLNGSKALCTQPAGTYGTVVQGPSIGSGYTWWKVNYDTSCDGWSVADGLNVATAEAPFTHTLAKGSTGEEVSMLQSVLNYLGYYHESATGFFGAATEAAVKAFQADHNMAAVGVVGSDTGRVLGQVRF
jgi:hypothetical protein